MAVEKGRYVTSSTVSAHREVHVIFLYHRSRVVIVGAGVIGLSAAVHLYERFGDLLEVTVVAENFSPSTTGDKAGMLMYPADWNDSDSLTSANPTRTEEQKRAHHWAKATFERYSTWYMWSPYCMAWCGVQIYNYSFE